MRCLTDDVFPKAYLVLPNEVPDIGRSSERKDRHSAGRDKGSARARVSGVEHYDARGHGNDDACAGQIEPVFKNDVVKFDLKQGDAERYRKKRYEKPQHPERRHGPPFRKQRAQGPQAEISREGKRCGKRKQAPCGREVVVQGLVKGKYEQP